MTVKIAIIGGTGFYDPKIFSSVKNEDIDTPYGCVNVVLGSFKGQEIAFMARHGVNHKVPPHLVNYRANIYALNILGVKTIFATAAVGSLNINLKPGQFVFIDQFLDFTAGRISTFVEDGVVHIDMTYPYCTKLRALLSKAADDLGLAHYNGGTYVCTQGPRFETAAEIKMFRHLGGDLVGMTSVPEVVLAREAGICYSSIAIVTNYAAGISPTKLSHQEVLEMMDDSAEDVRRLIMQAVSALEPNGVCSCNEQVDEM